MTPLSGQSNVTAQEVMDELVVRRGLSYVDAIAECERRAAVASAPYLTVAEALRREIVKALPDEDPVR